MEAGAHQSAVLLSLTAGAQVEARALEVHCRCRRWRCAAKFTTAVVVFASRSWNLVTFNTTGQWLLTGRTAADGSHRSVTTGHGRPQRHRQDQNLQCRQQLHCLLGARPHLLLRGAIHVGREDELPRGELQAQPW